MHQHATRELNGSEPRKYREGHTCSAAAKTRPDHVLAWHRNDLSKRKKDISDTEVAIDAGSWAWYLLDIYLSMDR